MPSDKFPWGWRTLLLVPLLCWTLLLAAMMSGCLNPIREQPCTLFDLLSSPFAEPVPRDRWSATAHRVHLWTILTYTISGLSVIPIVINQYYHGVIRLIGSLLAAMVLSSFLTLHLAFGTLFSATNADLANGTYANFKRLFFSIFIFGTISLYPKLYHDWFRGGNMLALSEHLRVWKHLLKRQRQETSQT